SDTPDAHAALLAILQAPPALIDPSTQTLVWRAVLAAPRPDFERRPFTPLEDAFAELMGEEGDNPLLDPIALAATYRAGIMGTWRRSDDPQWMLKGMLATVEGQRPPWMHW